MSREKAREERKRVKVVRSIGWVGGMLMVVVWDVVAKQCGGGCVWRQRSEVSEANERSGEHERVCEHRAARYE